MDKSKKFKKNKEEKRNVKLKNKILKEKQNKTNKGNKSNVNSNNKNSKKKENKRNVVKITLANPFTLDWPSLNYKDYTDIVSLLKISLTCIRENYVKYKAKREDKRNRTRTMKKNREESIAHSCTGQNPGRRDEESIAPSGSCGIQETIQTITKLDVNNEQVPEKTVGDNKEFQETLTTLQDQERQNTSAGLSIGSSSLVFGYNAVMRGLEKGAVVSVLVNVRAKPEFLVKTFIPVCTLKSIPVIPIDGLQDIVKEADVGIKSCLALGLTKDAVNDSNPFHNLYVKTCEALGFEASSCQHLEEETQVVARSISEESEPVESVLAQSEMPTTEQINSFHLRRSDTSERVFKPNEVRSDVGDLKTSTDISNCFIGLYAREKGQARSDMISEAVKRDKKTVKNGDVDISNMTSDSMFILDNEGEGTESDSQNLNPQPSPLGSYQLGNDKTSQLEDAVNTVKLNKKKRKVKEVAYIAAKVKKIKSNPNRKGGRK